MLFQVLTINIPELQMTKRPRMSKNSGHLCMIYRYFNNSYVYPVFGGAVIDDRFPNAWQDYRTNITAKPAASNKMLFLQFN